VQWDRNQSLVMDANPDYWGGPPKNRRITYFPIAEEATRIAGLRRGDLDIIFTVPVDQVQTLEGDADVDVVTLLSCDTHVLSIGGSGRAPYNIHQVRQAIDYAIDRDALINGILNGFAEIPRSVISPMVFGFNPNLPPHPHDPERAKALLAEAGMAAGFDAELQCVHGSLPKIEDLALTVANDLAQIGINARVTVHPDWAVGSPFLQQGNFDMFYNSWTTYTLDADMPFWRNWHSSVSREGVGKYDYSKDLDALLLTGRSSLDESVRQDAYNKAQVYMWDFPTRLALYHSEDIWGVRSNVHDFKPTASRILDLTQVTKT
jgi:ABC-type transport system substrate-binding protein